MRTVRVQSYPKEKRRPMDEGLWKFLGCVMISAGLFLLFLCIPGWAWAALAGAALVFLGFALISTCRR